MDDDGWRLAGARRGRRRSRPRRTSPCRCRRLPKATLDDETARFGVLLAGLMLLLVHRASWPSSRRRRARPGCRPETLPDAAPRAAAVVIAGAIATVVVAAAVYLGNIVVGRRSGDLRALCLQAARGRSDRARRRASCGSTLTDPGWLRSRRLDDFVADHGHLMHLFVVSPKLDRLWHLHPQREPRPARSSRRLPALPGGRYELFADVVHRTGVSETVTASFDTAGVGGTTVDRRRQRVAVDILRPDRLGAAR